MTTQSKQKGKLVPKLRFKGFDGEWEKRNIGSILTVGSGRDYKHLSKGYIPVFGTGGLMTMVDQFLYEGETVCIGRKGTIDKPMYYNGKIWTVDTLFYTHSFKNSSPKFVFNIFQKIKWKEHNEASGVPSLSKTTIEKIKIGIPTLPEQQKISSFLSSVDEKLSQLTRKKELLTQYKKGVMQQLFSGKLRFKDENGKEFSKWEEKRIKDFVLNNKGSMKIGPFGSQLKKTTFVSSGYKVYGQENIFISDFNYGDRYITEAHFNTLKTNELYPGDFVISTMGTIGKCCIVPSNIARGIMDSHIIRLQLDSAKILPSLLGQIFISHIIQKQVIRYSVGGIMDGLSMGIINKLKFLIPVNLEEQQKISTFLSSIDDKITAISAQISQTQSFKKGLLQQMFV